MKKRVSTMIIITAALLASAAASVHSEDDGLVRYSVTEWQKLTWTSDKPLWLSEIDGSIFVRPNKENVLLVKGIKTAFTASLAASRLEAEKIGIDIEEPSDRIEIKTVRPDVPGSKTRSRVDYDLRVPKNIVLKLETVSGRIDVDGTKGPVNAETVSGNIVVSNLEGPVTAKTVSGDIKIYYCPETLQAVSTSGKIIFEADKLTAPALALESKSGDIEIIMPDGVGATFETHTATGAIDTAKSGVKQVSESGGVSTYISGDGKVSIRITTVSGNIKFSRPEGK